MPVLLSANWLTAEIVNLDEQLMLKRPKCLIRESLARLCDKVLKEKVASAMQELFVEGSEAVEVVCPGC